MTDKRQLREGTPDVSAISERDGDEGTASTPEPLVVYLDDSKEALEEVQEVYEFNGLKCVIFTDPSEALKFCAKQDRILFLIDLNLDGLNGLEVVDELQQNRRDDQQIDCVVRSPPTPPFHLPCELAGKCRTPPMRSRALSCDHLRSPASPCDALAYDRCVCGCRCTGSTARAGAVALPGTR